ncbi:MAG TPA: proprotein convertase P-domain-containing protein [Pyrinomonadaceae bacterium]|jgi:subtilisin-like proprotein convertase family protein
MIKKSQILVCLLMFAVFFSSCGFAVRAQDSSVNPDKVKVLAEPMTDVAPGAVSVNPGGAELVPSAVFTNGSIVGIPDAAYNGTIGSMACSTINTASVVAPGTLVAGVSVNVALDHTWIGDLTIKLRAPDGKVLTLLNRPGSNAPDNGADNPIGDNSNWAAGTSIAFADGAGPEAETMGAALADSQNICAADGVCAHDPSPDTAPTPPASFADFNDGTARGAWSLCVGDSAQLDAGNIRSWTLNLIFAYPVSTTPNPNSIPDDGYAGGFGVVGMHCSTINTTGRNLGSTTVQGVYLDVNLSHTWVGDLTMKLRSPAGTVMTFLNRPGSNAADDGGAAVGNNANWSNTALQFRDGAGPEAETLGSGLTTDQRVCLDNGVCKYDPSPDTAASPASFAAAFNGQNVSGNWTLCVGDSALGDAGVVNSWTLKFISPTAVAPTAASVSVGGQAFSASGMPVRGAVVTLIDSTGAARAVRTGSFGYFRFDGVPSGAIYTVKVEAKGYTFAPQVVNVADELRELSFTAEP